MVAHFVELWIIQVLASVFYIFHRCIICSSVEYVTFVLYAHLWNIPQTCKLRICGMFQRGIFHGCANCISVEYSTVALRKQVYALQNLDPHSVILYKSFETSRQVQLIKSSKSKFY